MKKKIDSFIKYHINAVLRNLFSKEPLLVGNSKRELDKQTVVDIVYDARFTAKLYAFYGMRERLTSEVRSFIGSVEQYFGLPYDEGLTKIHPLKENFLNQWLLDCINRKFKDKEIKKTAKIDNNSPFNGNGETGDAFSEMKRYTDPKGCRLVEGMQNMLECNGCGRNSPYFHRAAAIFLKTIPNSIADLAACLGRDNSPANNKTTDNSIFLTAAKTDIVGLTTGRDLSCVVPTEIALLSSPTLENLFFKKMHDNSLQIFQSKSEQRIRISEEGPIMIGIDTSWSMKGEREILAKTLALATIVVAQKKKRPVELYEFSIEANKLVINDFYKQRKEITEFIANSQGGGTDVNDVLRQMTGNYNDDYSVFKNADILLVSDFEIPELTDSMKNRCNEAKNMGARFYALNVGSESANDYFDLCYKRYANRGFDIFEIY
ncbi:MAG: hypothetical protein IKP81_07305 [Paludibacteraceae bacterium]|nr:hypothetical protein [Paludibacteraceae bacterium]